MLSNLSLRSPDINRVEIRADTYPLPLLPQDLLTTYMWIYLNRPLTDNSKSSFRSEIYSEIYPFHIILCFMSHIEYCTFEPVVKAVVKKGTCLFGPLSARFVSSAEPTGLFPTRLRLGPSQRPCFANSASLVQLNHCWRTHGRCDNRNHKYYCPRVWLHLLDAVWIVVSSRWRSLKIRPFQ